jgi:hypothetical protein
MLRAFFLMLTKCRFYVYFEPGPLPGRDEKDVALLIL